MVSGIVTSGVSNARNREKSLALHAAAMADMVANVTSVCVMQSQQVESVERAVS